MNYNPKSCVGFVVIICFLFFPYYVLLFSHQFSVLFVLERCNSIFFKRAFFNMYPLNFLFCDDPYPYVHSILRLILLNQDRF